MAGVPMIVRVGLTWSGSPAAKPQAAGRIVGAVLAGGLGQVAVPGDELAALAAAADPFEFAALGPRRQVLWWPARV